MIKLLMKNHLVSDSVETMHIYDARIFLQGMTNDVGFTFSLGNTTHAIYD
jgi:hypothetical protein